MANHTVYFFTGKDEFRKTLSIDKIKAKLGLGVLSLDFNIYYGKDAQASDIIAVLKTPPLAAKKRLVILKEAEKLCEPDKLTLTDLFKNPPDNSIFVITTQNKSGSNDKLDQAAKKYAKCADFSSLDQKELSEWIKAEFQLRKKSIEQQALEILRENAQDDLNYMSQHVEMLCVYTGKRKVITAKDVAALVGESLDVSTFKLVDEIALKKEKNALHTLMVLMQTGKTAYEILGLVAWHIRRMGKVKSLLKGGMSKEKIAQELKMSFYVAQKVIEQARNFSSQEIRRAQRLIIETDMRLKKSIASPKTLLEMLIVKLNLS
ncbi:MAG: DNA polymerase III subunit delta [Candidatus Omnitrophota bacterium]